MSLIGSSYQELAPPTALRHAVDCLWVRTVGADDPSPLRILPDGCVDLIWRRGGGAFVAGPDTGPNLFSSPPGTTLVGVRFRPGAGGGALGMPLSELRDLRADVAAVDRGLGELLDPGLSTREALRRLGLTAARRVAAAGPDAAIAEAARRLADPCARVEALANELGLSERQLRRRSHAAVGYGPKVLQRVLRFQRFLARLDADGRGADLARLAFDTGYADQAHLTRDCQRLAGVSPGALALARA